MARIYTDLEIATINARSQAVIDRIYKTDSRVYKGIKFGKLIDVTNEQTTENNTATIIDNTQTIEVNSEQVEENLELIRDLQRDVVETRAQKADRCYAIAMSIIL